MAKTLYKAEFKDKLPLGGIATGHIDLGHDASVSSDFSPFFTIKAEKDGELFDARILQSSHDEKISLPCFEKSSALSFFPFAECFLSDTSFPANIRVTAFSPFIPLSDTDSGIPGVLFDFEVTNTSKERIDYSICGVIQNTNSCAFNRMGCTNTGEAYIHLSGNETDSKNVCIATDSKNVSFCEYISDTKDFTYNFTKNTTLYNKTTSENTKEFPYGALCTHFSLESNESTTVTFCLSWYTSENEFSRNYYAQYFESSLECASYLFRQKDRLLGDSLQFCENIFGTMLAEEILYEVNKDLFDFSRNNYLRLEDGSLLSGRKDDFFGLESFLSRCDILTSLFPHMEYSETQRFYKKEMYQSADEKQIVMCVLKSYRKYLLSNDTDELIEDWYYIVKCAEKLFGEDGQKKCDLDCSLVYSATKALAEMSEAVRDKKRCEIYSDMLKELPKEQFPVHSSNGFAKINEVLGFEYNATKNHIGFCPKSNLCTSDTGGSFRCFFCTPQGFGYVEEGIDYIEINLLKGTLNIRSFGVPRTPRLVQYGGRNWKFENKNLVAVLDSDLEVTPQKKLTIFIDIKQ